MSFTFGDGSDLRDLFFETATELLQTLNEEALELEKRPSDTELVRSIRRTIHTLKGDSAACGYTELTDLAHELEDALAPDVVTHIGSGLAELILLAADTFQEMLRAYRDNKKPPAGEKVRARMKGLAHRPSPKNVVPYRLSGRFAWSEYEQMAILNAIAKGTKVFNIAMALDPQCAMIDAAVQMTRTACAKAGELLAMSPSGSIPANLDVIEVALASKRSEDWLRKKLRIPSMISDVVVEQIKEQQLKAEQVEAEEPAAEVPVQPAASRSGEKPAQQLPQQAPEPESLLEIEELTAVEALKASAMPTLHPSDSPVPVFDTHAFLPGSPALESATSTAAQTTSALTHSETTLRVEAERIDDVMNLMGELIIAKSMLTQAVSDFDRRYSKDPLRAKFSDALAFQARVLNDLQKSIMKIRMVPVEQLFRRFPRIVRDVAKGLGKEVALEIIGQDTDVDKSILDILSEPMTHLVRNAVDHGLEPPMERIAQGKPSQGTVRLNAYHQGNEIAIEIADDGRGIDRSRLIRKAIDMGITTPDQAVRMNESETLELIFEPGFSTASQVTAISGRGVGLDVVKSVMQRLKGHVRVESEIGKGTTFMLRVPLTLAIIKALLFRAGGKLYAIPLSTVLEITRAQESEVHNVDGQEVVQLRDQVLALVRIERLSYVTAKRGRKLFIVVISVNERKFGLVVDKLVGEEELVIKALDDQLVSTDLVSGASILGDGTVVLILNALAVVSRLSRAQAKGVPA